MMIEWRMDLWQLRSTTTMSPGATVVCHTILFEVEVPLVTKYRWSQLKMRAALRSEAATGPVWSSSCPSSSTALQTSARSMFSPKNWWNICATGPQVRAVARVVPRRLEDRRRQRVQVVRRVADEVAGHEPRRVLEHVDEAVQLPQDLVREVLRGARLAEQEDRDVGIATARLD